MAKKGSPSNVSKFLPRRKDRKEYEPTVRVPMPHKVRILGRDVVIAYSNEEEGFTDAGEMEEHSLTITVREDQLEIEEADVVLHEINHALDYLLNLELTERQVRLLATGLIGVFQDNPELAAYLTRPMSKIN